MSYSVAISLGGFCQVTYQLKKSKLAWAQSPFDWLVVPFESIENIISDRGGRFGLNVSRFDNGFNRGRDVLCNHYNIMHAHDFPVNELEEPTINEENIEQVRSKFSHKTDEFMRSCQISGRKLFVRLGGSTFRMNAWPYMSDEFPTKLSAVARLCENLSKICVDDFDLLMVTYGNVTTFVADAQVPPNVIFRNIPIPSELTWQGSEEIWASLLSELPVHASPAKEKWPVLNKYRNRLSFALANLPVASQLLSFANPVARPNKDSAQV
jgi:hypothetical protein